MRRLVVIFLILLSFVSKAQFGSEMFIGRKPNPPAATAFNPVFVNGQSLQCVSSCSNAIPLPALSLTAGNTIVVAFRYQFNGVSTCASVTDNAGNSYTNLLVTGTVTNIDHFEIWYKTNAAGNASNVVTLNFGVGYSPGFLWMGSVQYSGVTAIDVSASGTLSASTATSVTTGSYTTTAANTLGVFIGTLDAANLTISATVSGSAATIRAQDATTNVLTFFDKQFSSIQTAQTATMTATAAQHWAVGVLFLK